MSGLLGVNRLADVARAARLSGDELLPKLRKGLAKVGPPARRAVQEQAEKKLPRGNGYAAAMARAVRVRVKTDTGFSSASVTIVTYASGQQERRDLPTINKGVLRHPVYGHRRRAWVAQRVPARFWDDAMDKVSDDAEKRVRDVLDETTRTLKG